MIEDTLNLTAGKKRKRRSTSIRVYLKLITQFASFELRFMGINDLGTQGILQKRLAKYMNYLDQDDKLLIKENIDELSIEELSHAVEERGMRSANQEVENMRRGLKYWLSLTQPANPDHQVIPPGLLVFSRMFLLNANYGKQ